MRRLAQKNGQKSLLPLQKQLIKLIDDGMEKAGLTAAQVATQVGISRPYLSQLLSGSRSGTIEAWDLLLRAVYGRSTPQIRIGPGEVADSPRAAVPPAARPDGRGRPSNVGRPPPSGALMPASKRFGGGR